MLPDPPAKRDFLVFTAEMATPRVLLVPLDPRAPKAPSEHEVLPEPLDNKVPTVTMAKRGLKAPPARPGPVVLRATSVKRELKALLALRVKSAKPVPMALRVNKVQLEHKGLAAKQVSVVRLVPAATPAPQAPLAAKAPSALPAPTATRAPPDKLGRPVLRVRRVTSGLSVKRV